MNVESEPAKEVAYVTGWLVPRGYLEKGDCLGWVRGENFTSSSKNLEAFFLTPSLSQERRCLVPGLSSEIVQDLGTRRVTI